MPVLLTKPWFLQGNEVNPCTSTKSGRNWRMTEMCGLCVSSWECCQHKLGVVKKRGIAVAAGRHFAGTEPKSRWETAKTTMCVGKGQPRGERTSSAVLFLYCEGHRAWARESWKEIEGCRDGEIKPTRNEKSRTKWGLRVSWGPQQRQQGFVRGTGAEGRWNTPHQETESIPQQREGCVSSEKQVTVIVLWALKCQHGQGSLLHSGYRQRATINSLMREDSELPGAVLI